ncbi:eukaryotic translation elongation factor 1 epsilon-1 [Lutzomyia longipalpis]|uniref:eukaryotic translation elongation factor 1 epsilon-1 n=1 Tax=Lutzomyia longipalpis TaxID=7200 RepID=UPI0024843503|nr:eukaryotic translation elongation factor 1 epsilon-1 [Lutzomyia longipalpis]
MSQIEIIQKISNYLHVDPGKLSQNREKVVTRTLNGDKHVMGFATILGSLAGKKYKNLEEECLVRQWIEYCSLHANPTLLTNRSHQRCLLEELNAYLATRSYFVGHSLTLADVVVFYSLNQTIASFQNSDKEKFIHLSRWFDHIQQVESVRQGMMLVNFTSLRTIR